MKGNKVSKTHSVQNRALAAPNRWLKPTAADQEDLLRIWTNIQRLADEIYELGQAIGLERMELPQWINTKIFERVLEGKKPLTKDMIRAEKLMVGFATFLRTVHKTFIDGRGDWSTILETASPSVRQLFNQVTRFGYTDSRAKRLTNRLQSVATKVDKKKQTRGQQQANRKMQNKINISRQKGVSIKPKDTSDPSTYVKLKSFIGKGGRKFVIIRGKKVYYTK